MTQITKEQIKYFFSKARREFGDCNDIKALALRGLATMPRPIEEAPKDGSYILAFGGEHGSELSGHEYEVTHKGPTIVSWNGRDTWWEPGELCDYVWPTHFIPLSALEIEPRAAIAAAEAE